MQRLVIPLTDPEATDASRFGPKAANQAALGQAGLPIPDGFCVDAEAYRMQIAALGLTEAQWTSLALFAGASLWLRAQLDGSAQGDTR